MLNQIEIINRILSNESPWKPVYVKVICVLGYVTCLGFEDSKQYGGLFYKMRSLLDVQGGPVKHGRYTLHARYYRVGGKDL